MQVRVLTSTMYTTSALTYMYFNISSQIHTVFGSYAETIVKALHSITHHKETRRRILVMIP